MVCSIVLISLARSYLEMAAQRCVAVQGTTLWNVLITPVTLLKSAARSMVFQAAILKVMSGRRLTSDRPFEII